MTVESMLTEGIYLMFIGMGFVVTFLTILVLILTQMEKFVDHEADAALANTDNQQNNHQTSNSTLKAVISAAVHQHRRRSGK